MSVSSESLPPVQLRDATSSDVPTIHAIYAHHVLTGTATFEEVPPTLDTMQGRWTSISQAGYPYIVAVRQNGSGEEDILGYAYASPLRTRIAFRFTTEDSIYLKPDAQGQGIGRRLLDLLIERCTSMGMRQMVAVIGDSTNAGSIGVHKAAGFSHVGIMPSTGLKFGRWIDTVLMQRPLGDGGSTIPTQTPPNIGLFK